MPTTKPKRTKSDTRKPARCAPRLAVLKVDQYADLDKTEKRRYDAIRDVEAIFDAMAQAQLDAQAVGFSASYRATDSSRSTNEPDAALFAASQHPSPAPDWLAEATEALAGITRVGRLARFHWPPAFAPGTVVTQDGESITVGGRGNSVPLCSWCGEVAPSGRDNDTGKTLVHKVGDFTVHSRPCYDQARQEAAGNRIRAKTTLLVAITNRVATRKKAG